MRCQRAADQRHYQYLNISRPCAPGKQMSVHSSGANHREYFLQRTVKLGSSPAMATPPSSLHRGTLWRQEHKTQALSNACNRFLFVDKMAKLMIKERLLRFVDGYVQIVHLTKCLAAICVLLDTDESKKSIENLVMFQHNELLPTTAGTNIG